MNYEETIEYLYSQLPVFQHIGGDAYKPGLDNSLKLSLLFNDPYRSYKTIHVGGTNGKGSTSHTLAAVLQEAGYKVGLFTSPHLIDFRERIRVDGQMIDQQYIVEFVETSQKDFEPIGCSFFELTMMLAFCYFRDQKVDIAIIEVGLGGRLDSTNIINPIISIITNIGFDHTQFLGNTLQEIAGEKAGIIKKDIPVVIGEYLPETKDIFVQKALEEHASIVFAEDEKTLVSSKKEGDKWIYKTETLECVEGGLGGLAQSKNANTILTAIEVLRKCDLDISDNSILSGFKNVAVLTGLRGRWQVIQQEPMVVADTAHNKEGIQYVVDQLLLNGQDYNTLHIIIGFAKDKDVDHVLEILPRSAVYYFVNAHIDRALPAAQLEKKAMKYGLLGRNYICIKDAYTEALKVADRSDIIFVGGSNFVVGEFLSNLSQTE